MELQTRLEAHTAVVTLSGRLDAHFSSQLDTRLHELIEFEKPRSIILDCAGMHYLSSAGIRVLLKLLKRLRADGGDLLLAGLQDYCRKVLSIAGFVEALPQYDSVAEALAAQGLGGRSDWETFEGPTSRGRYLHAPTHDNQASFIRVLGHIEDVLHARVTPEMIRSKRFSETEFSIGLGGLGDRVEDYFTLLGEMVTIGGTMVWLPTDGHDTPDYLIPKNDTGGVTIRTAFNVALQGPFHQLFQFTAADPAGASIAEIYRDLFAFFHQHAPEFRGGLAVAMRAEMATVHGSGVRYAPVAPLAPKNGKLITDPSNFVDWFEIDKEPRWRHVTGLLTGVGIDLQARHHEYQQNLLGACFYLNPANPQATDQMLHNHGVFFDPLPFPESPGSLEEEITNVVDVGNFIDMRHLLDGSKIHRALIGAARIEDFMPDPA